MKRKEWKRKKSPTDLFTIAELQSLSELHIISRSPNLEALKWRKGRPGEKQASDKAVGRNPVKLFENSVSAKRKMKQKK